MGHLAPGHPARGLSRSGPARLTFSEIRRRALRNGGVAADPYRTRETVDSQGATLSPGSGSRACFRFPPRFGLFSFEAGFVFSYKGAKFGIVILFAIQGIVQRAFGVFFRHGYDISSAGVAAVQPLTDCLHSSETVCGKNRLRLRSPGRCRPVASIFSKSIYHENRAFTTYYVLSAAGLKNCPPLDRCNCAC
jgi:hypothetical protein